jgi:hypothetical protein
MKIDFPDFAQDADTLVAVAVGAILATLGGMVANLWEERQQRVRLERSAALIFGEILASLRVMMRAVDDAKGRGDPFGPLTMRLLRGARREVDAYERSRLALSDIRNADLRLSVHALMVRFALGIDATLETEDPAARELSYEYLLVLVPKINPLVNRLLPLAGQPVSPYDELTHTPDGVAPSS